MSKLIHVKITKKMRNDMQNLIDYGLFSNQAEIVREGIREIMLKYTKKR